MPRREEVRDVLLAEIRRGAYPDRRLPRERDMAARFGITRITLREALGDLAAAEEIESRPRLGWYVRTDRRREFPLRSIDATLPRLDVWGTFCHRNGLYGIAPTTVSIGVPPRHVREHLRLGETERCTIRHRVRQVWNEGVKAYEPWGLSTAYWPLFVAEGTALMRTGSGPEVDLQDPSPLAIARAAGYPPDVHRDVVSARPGEPAELDELALDRRSYVLTVCRTSRTPDGLPVRVTHDVLDPRRFRLTVEA